jgi:hypothetical protein
MTAGYCRGCRQNLLLLGGILSLVTACSRTGLLDRVTAPARGDADGKTAIDVGPDRGVDLLEPDKSDTGMDGALDAAADARPDRPADASPDRAADAGSDRGIDQAVDRVLEAAPKLDLGRADDGRRDGTSRDLPLNGAEVGMLELVAGQLGASGARDGIGGEARFGGPSGMATDGMGNLFVADGNQTIRKVVLATREVSTLAGSAGDSGSNDGIGSAARFQTPSDVAYDGAGNLLVADADNETIRKVVIATGAVTTLAGSAGAYGNADGTGGKARFGHTLAVASDGVGNLFVADADNLTIRKVVIATGEVTTLAGVAGSNSEYRDGTGASARFTAPRALACDKAGNVFVADGVFIRQVVAATGMVSTLVGNPKECSVKDDAGPLPVYCSYYLTGLSYDGAGSLFVAHPTGVSGSEIHQVSISTGVDTTVVSEADLAAACSWSFPGHVHVVSEGADKVYITAEAGNICELAVATRTVTKLVGAGPAPGGTDGIGAEARFDSPRSLASDGAGNLFVTDGNGLIEGGALRRIRLASSEVTPLVGRSPPSWPTGLALDRKGNLFVAEQNCAIIHEIVVDTAGVIPLAGSCNLGHQDGTGNEASFESPTSLAYDGAGSLFVTEAGAQSIRKVDTATGTVTTLALSAPRLGSNDGSVSSAELGHLTASACDEAGNLFVGDSENCAIYKIDLATGAATILAGSPGDCGFADGTGSIARFYAPEYLTSDGAGNLYVSDPVNHAVRKVAVATGTVTTVVGSPDRFGGVILGPLPAHLNHPVGLAFVPGTGLFIADAGENAILLAEL